MRPPRKSRPNSRLFEPKGSFFRYEVFAGGKLVHLGISIDLEAAREECGQRWPEGRFFQVGEKTTETVAAEWLEKNRGRAR